MFKTVIKIVIAGAILNILWIPAQASIAAMLSGNTPKGFNTILIIGAIGIFFGLLLIFVIKGNWLLGAAGIGLFFLVNWATGWLQGTAGLFVAPARGLILGASIALIIKDAWSWVTKAPATPATPATPPTPQVPPHLRP